MGGQGCCATSCCEKKEKCKLTSTVIEDVCGRMCKDKTECAKVCPLICEVAGEELCKYMKIRCSGKCLDKWYEREFQSLCYNVCRRLGDASACEKSCEEICLIAVEILCEYFSEEICEFYYQYPKSCEFPQLAERCNIKSFNVANDCVEECRFICSRVSKTLCEKLCSVKNDSKCSTSCLDKCEEKISCLCKKACFRSYKARETASLSCTSIVGKVAPQFKAQLVCSECPLKQLTHRDFIGRILILAFYPANFTFVCPTEIIELNKRKDEFKAHGADIVLVSTDSIYSHMAWKESCKPENGGIGMISLKMIEDPTHKISQSFGLLKADGHSNRATVIIDQNRYIRHLSVYDDCVGRSVDELLRIVSALKACENVPNGVCPVNWNSSQKVLTADLKSVGEYLKKK